MIMITMMMIITTTTSDDYEFSVLHNTWLQKSLENCHKKDWNNSNAKTATRKTGITAMQKEPQLFSIILWTSLSKSFDILKLPAILYVMDIFIKQLTEF